MFENIKNQRRELSMKKIIIFLFVIALAISLIACSNQNEEPVVSDNYNNEMSDEADVFPAIADATLYRGEVEYVSITDGLNTLVLRQVPGTDFGADSLTVLIDAETRSDFSIADVHLGDHIAVYYNAAYSNPDGLTSMEVTAIVLRLLPPASASVFVGTITDLEVYPTGGNLRLFIDEDESYEIVVTFGNFTQLYLDINDLSVGDGIVVFTDGASNTSDYTLHVQALEIRLV